MKKPQKWLRVTAALDVLEDTECAISYYRETDYPDKLNGKYLFTYGLLQALFVQEDAVNSINMALFNNEVDFKKNYPDAHAVREMRNDIVGHPTCRNNKQFIHLVQCSLSKSHLRYIRTEDCDNPFSILDVDIAKAISDVAICVNTVLTAAIEKLEKEFREYIEMHRDRKMKEIFKLLDYAREKTLTDTHMASWGYTSTKQMVEKCEEELRQRYGGIDVIDSYKYLLEEIHELYNILDNVLPQIPYNLQSGINKYLLQHLFVKLKELERFCAETDEYFENYGEECSKRTEGLALPQISFEFQDDILE